MRPTVRLAVLTALAATPIPALADTQVGTLSCDVSGGIGLLIVQQQQLACTFTHTDGLVEGYRGAIGQFGITLGAVKEGHLVWGVLATTDAVPLGALAGSYAGIGANASLGVGGGANVLVGGVGRSFSLQPISVQGQIGVNIAGGVTQLTLAPGP